MVLLAWGMEVDDSIKDIKDPVERAEAIIEASGNEHITRVEEGDLYDVAVYNEAETHHFHNGFYNRFYDAGFFPLHTDFEEESVEFVDSTKN